MVHREAAGWAGGFGVASGLRCCAALVAGIAAAAAVLPVQAQLGVSDGGQAAYSYAIAVPPGIAGMQPHLSLAYAQGGINGPLGTGWSLQGLSSITRCPATLATDGKRSGVRYLPSDKLCLDSQRLVQTDENGNPAAAANSTGVAVAGQTDDARGLTGASTYREFRTEKDSFVRVRAYGSAGGSDANGPAFFRVWTKSGQIYEYGDPGASTPSRALITAQGKSVVVAWPVVAIREPATPNRIEFSYEVRDTAWGSGPTANSPLPGREWNIQEIHYGGNKVIFSYSDRPTTASGTAHDAAEAYHEGAKTVSVRRLDAITTYVNTPGIATAGPGSGVPVKTYKLGYTRNNNSGRSQLTSLRECAGGPASTRCMPATSLSYYPGNADSYTASTAFNLATVALTSASGNHGVFPGDWDGDGKTDFIRWSDNPAENQLYLSNGDGSFSASAAFNIKDQHLFKSDGCYTAMLLDLDGNGTSDILRYAAAVKQDGSACANPGASLLYSGVGDGSFVARPITGVTLERQVSTSYTGCWDGSKPVNMGCPNSQQAWIGWTRGSGFYILDVDGDGKADLMTAHLPAQVPAASYADPCTAAPCTRVYRGNGQGGFTEIPGVNVNGQTLYSGASAGAGTIQPVIDVDGDGLADFTDLSNSYLFYINGQYTAWRSRGDGNFDRFPFVRLCTHSIDFNGDQRPDCIRTPSQNAASGTNALRVSTGAASDQPVAGFNLNGAGYELEGAGVGFLAADFNQDGRQDILRWKDDPAQNRLWLSNGDGTFRQSTSFNLTSTVLRASNGSADFIIGDFTGQGQVEILRMAAGAASGTTPATQNQLFVRTNHSIPSNWIPPETLYRAAEPSGAATTLTFAPLLNTALAGTPGRYTSDRRTDRKAQPPLADLSVPMPVVVTQATDSGVGSEQVKTEFAYTGLKVDLNGRGPVGFREIRRQSPGPNGEPLTVATQYVQAYPYVGVASLSETRKGTLAETAAPLLSRASHIYCETAASLAQRAAATAEAPCPVAAGGPPKILRPYLLASTESGWDLGGAALPTVVTSNTVNPHGDTTAVRVETRGTVAGTAQTFVKQTTNTFCEPNTANCPNNTSGDNWILGRLQRATVQQSAPDSLAVLTAPTPLSLAVVPAALNLTSGTPGATVSGVVTLNSSGGTPPYAFAWERVSGSRIGVTGSQLATFSTTVNVADDFTESFRVRLTDGAGATVTATVAVAARGPAYPPLGVTMSPPSFGASATLAATVSGGVAPFTYTWSKSGQVSFAATTSAHMVIATTQLPPICEMNTGTIFVEVRDAAGQVKTASAQGRRTNPPRSGQQCF